MFCNKVRIKLKKALAQFDQFVDEHAETALKISTALKNVLTSPAADVLTALIPGEADDIIRKHLVAALEQAIGVLTITEQCRQHTDLGERLKCFAQHLSAQSPELRDALLHKLASILTANLDGRRLPAHLYDLYVQAKYAANK